MIISVDTETTGPDFFHDSRPFFVSTVNEDEVARVWEWPVDPYTREVCPSSLQRKSLAEYLEGHTLVFQNAGFDLRALSTIGINLSWPGFTVPQLKHDDPIYCEVETVHDTQLMSQAFNNLGVGGEGRHKLKPLALHYLDYPITDETKLRKAVVRARDKARRLPKPWKQGMKRVGTPAVFYDYWMPKAMVDHRIPNVPPEWETLCAHYAIGDVMRTLGLYFFFREGLEADKLWGNYLRELALMPRTYMMEFKGLHLKRDIHAAEMDRFDKEAARCNACAQRILGKINVNSGEQLSTSLAKLGVSLAGRTTKGKVSTDADSLRSAVQYLEIAKPFHGAGRIAKAVRYIIGWDPDEGDNCERKIPGYRVYIGGKRFLNNYLCHLDENDVIHPSFNATGTIWTRYSCSDPNSQNVSKKAVLPLRAIFGPPEGSIWLAIDYSQLELRIFAYAAEDDKLIKSFELGHDFHHTVACEIFDTDSPTPEQRRIAKNVNFAILFGAGAPKIDATSGRPGTAAKFAAQFPNAKKFMDKIVTSVRDKGYVLTLDGRRLYVPPSKPFEGVSGVVQGTAGAIVKNAMNSICDVGLVDWDGSSIVANIHDELLIQIDKDYPFKAIGKRICQIMENEGTKLNCVTPVEATLIRDSWANGHKMQWSKAA